MRDSRRRSWCGSLWEPSMKCPHCRQIENDRVLDSRVSTDGASIRRRRECLTCHQRFSTYERYATAVAPVKAKAVAVKLRMIAGSLEAHVVRTPYTKSANALKIK